METTIHLMESYRGRDRIIGTVFYGCMFGAGSTKGDVAVKFGTVARELSTTRTVLRLFDDILLMKYISAYGLGKQEKDPVCRILQIFKNLTDALIFETDHICWLCQKHILPWAPEKWGIVCIAAWATSLSLGILRCLRRLMVTKKRIEELTNLKELTAPHMNYESQRQEMTTLHTEKRVDLLTLLKSVLDLLNAVNWLPQGFLWAGKFSAAYTGFFGLVSSAVGWYLTFASTRGYSS